MDKYYTPTIEEFHIGFEYEYLDEKGDWIKDVPIEITPDDYDEQSYGLRVKYLDKEDIESLGFKSKSPRSDMKHHHYFWKDAPGKLGYWTEVSIDFRWGYKDISIKGVRGYENDYLFRGIIKNKSELKQILKQLNIE